jgi:hypothetical protein
MILMPVVLIQVPGWQSLVLITAPRFNACSTFSSSFLMVVESAELDHDRRRTLASIFRFIAVSPDFQSSPNLKSEF